MENVIVGVVRIAVESGPVRDLGLLLGTFRGLGLGTVCGWKRGGKDPADLTASKVNEYLMSNLMTLTHAQNRG